MSANPGGRGMSAVAADLNNDGWMDVYVANDSMENYFYENKGDGTFATRRSSSGSPSARTGRASPRWAPRWPTSTRDGSLDILIPDMDYGSLLSKQGGFYDDLVGRSGLAVICGQYTGWGAVLFDYDNDGYPDVFIANGNAHHEYPEDAVLARNDGKGVFVDVARGVGRVLPDEVGEPRRRPGPTSTTTATWTCSWSTPPARRTCCATAAGPATTG